LALAKLNKPIILVLNEGKTKVNQWFWK
jgi:hypothetical protein